MNEQYIFKWLEGFKLDIGKQLDAIGVRIDRIESKLFTGNGDALIPQFRMLKQAHEECRKRQDHKGRKVWETFKIIAAAVIAATITRFF